MVHLGTIHIVKLRINETERDIFSIHAKNRHLEMKVYIVTRNPFPNGMAPANRIKCYAQAISSQGVDVEILIYTRTEVYGRPSHNICGSGVYSGIPYNYIGGTPLRHRNVILRRWYDYKDKKDCLNYIRHNVKENDVVLAYLGLDVDYALKLIDVVHSNGAKYFNELCELPYGTTQETKATVKGRRKTIELLSPKCDGHICISKALKDYISPYTSDSSRNIIVPILVDFKQYELDDRSEYASFPYIFHAGSLTEQKDGVLGMLESFGMSCNSLDPTVKFVLTGSLDKAKAADQIREILTRYGIEQRVIFTGYLSDESLKKYLSEASLVIINKYDTQQNRYCFSTKLGEYLAAGKPVIITKIGEAMNWLKDGETAYVVDPEEKLQLSQAIINAFTDNDKRKKIAESGRELCQKSFDYRAWGKTLINAFTYKM